MASNMKEKNDKKAWAAYEKAGKKLIAETMRKRKALEKKYRNISKPEYGMDNDPETKEAVEITKWFSQELKRLRKKYGIE